MKEVINNNHLKMDTDKELLTIRDRFAALAMQGLITEVDSPKYETLAQMSYLMADAMMKERAK